MIVYLYELFNKINNYIIRSTSLYKDTIPIDKELSLMIYNNEEHIGEKINPFILRDHFEPNFLNIFRSKL